jgi:hypothetical protein
VGEADVETWINEKRFEEPEEEEFANRLSADDVAWFYNPFPADKEPRFVLHNLLNLPDKYYPCAVISKLQTVDKVKFNKFSKIQSLLVAEKNSKSASGFHAYGISSILDDFRIWIVKNETWDEIVQCQACGQLQVEASNIPTGKDYLSSGMYGIYSDWCPQCEAFCDRCDRRTSRANLSGGLCDECRIYFKHYGD